MDIKGSKTEKPKAPKLCSTCKHTRARFEIAAFN